MKFLMQGGGIYKPENHYAGGIAIDPQDVNTVYISANVDPVTGKKTVDDRYQIYRGITKDNGQTFDFEQLTFEAGKDNLRPNSSTWA